jgi:IMP cyclohydrolase
MIINTDKIRFRKMTDYIAVYGTQDNPYSSDYDVLTADEAANMASSLDGIVDKLKDEAERLREMSKMPNLY